MVSKAKMCFECVTTFLFKNKLSSPELLTAYRMNWTRKSQYLLLCYLATNIGFLYVPLHPFVKQLFVSYDRRQNYPQVEKNYPILDEDNFEDDPNYQKMILEMTYCCIQYLVLIIATIISILLLEWTKWYFRVLPFVLFVMNICSLPLFPVFPFRVQMLMSLFVFTSIFVNVIFYADTVAHHLLFCSVELCWFLWRMACIFDDFGTFDAECDILWVVLSLTIVSLIS